MSKGIKLFLKMVIGVSAIGIVALAFYATIILSSNKETVKDMGYDTKKLPIWYVGEKPADLYSKAYIDNRATEIDFELSIEDIQLESLNTKTDKIVSGQDYYLYFTVVFTPKSQAFELKDGESLGRVTSNDWAYTLYIPKDKSESDYHRVIPAGETVKLRYYVKTNEPVKDLGFYVNSNIDSETFRHYFRFIKDPKAE